MGSEMCIRDSLSAEVEGERQAVTSAARGRTMASDEGINGVLFAAAGLPITSPTCVWNSLLHC